MKQSDLEPYLSLFVMMLLIFLPVIISYPVAWLILFIRNFMFS